MAAPTDEILQSALQLSDEGRVTLAEELLASVPAMLPSAERAWEPELLRRLEAIERGESQAQPAEEV